MRLFALIILLTALPARAQIMDVPSVPHMADMPGAVLQEIIRTDTMIYARWSLPADGDAVEAIYTDEYAEPVYWVASEYFGFPGIFDGLPVPRDASMQSRALVAAYLETVAVIRETRLKLREVTQ